MRCRAAAHTLVMFPLFSNKLGDIFRFTLSLLMTDKSDFKEKPTQIHTVDSSGLSEYIQERHSDNNPNYLIWFKIIPACRTPCCCMSAPKPTRADASFTSALVPYF